MIYALLVPREYMHYKYVKNVVYNDFCPSPDKYIVVEIAVKVKATKRCVKILRIYTFGIIQLQSFYLFFVLYLCV